jgi:hypothetical protein
MEIILSVKPYDMIRHPVARSMMEGVGTSPVQPRCFIYERAKLLDTTAYRVTTTLAMFVKMLDTIMAAMDPSELGPLSRAARILFAIERDGDIEWSEWWERACAMMVVSRVHDMLQEKYHSEFIHNIFGVTDENFDYEVKLRSDLTVSIGKTNGDRMWVPDRVSNQLSVAPPKHPGFDISFCFDGIDGRPVWVFVDVKVNTPTKETRTIESIYARNLLLTMIQYIDIANLTSLKLHEKKVAIKDMYYVLSIYGKELNAQDKRQLQSEVVTYVEQNLTNPEVKNMLASCKIKIMPNAAITEAKKLLLEYVNTCWDTNVAFQGTQDLEANMVPVLIPIAHLAQATVEDENKQ